MLVKQKQQYFSCIIYLQRILNLCVKLILNNVRKSFVTLILLGVGYSHLMPAEDSAIAPCFTRLAHFFFFLEGFQEVCFIQQAMDKAPLKKRQSK